MELQKQSLFGVEFALVDYETASDLIVEQAEKNRSYGVSALAVHGLVMSVRRKELGRLLKRVDMVVPDGQPIRWALNSFYGVGLEERVYGPALTLHVLRKADQRCLKVFLFGSTKDTVEKFSRFIAETFKNVRICGLHADRFRDATPEEDRADTRMINDSGAHIVFVGRGSPRQEVWIAEHLGRINATMMAVGAAFDFHAGTLKQAPVWMQDRGLEWFYRLLKEPKRLWKRYLFTNSYFIYLCIKHKLFSRG